MRPAPVRLPGLCARKRFRYKHILNQRRFPGTGNAGDAGENAERNFDIDVLEIVLGRAGDLDNR